MKLERSLEGKQVRIVTTDNEVLTGVVEDYIFPEDNEPEGVSGINVYNCPKPGEWTGPVSYTHLDVYKRQSYHSY